MVGLRSRPDRFAQAHYNRRDFGPPYRSSLIAEVEAAGRRNVASEIEVHHVAGPLEIVDPPAPHGLKDWVPVAGILSALVPGMVEAALVTLRDFGTKSFGEAIEPAIELADGFPLDEFRSRSIRASVKYLEAWPTSKKVFLQNGPMARTGDIFRQPDLAHTLRSMVAGTNQVRSASEKSQRLSAVLESMNGDRPLTPPAWLHEVLNAPAELAPALQAVLGGELESVVVDSPAFALRAIEILKRDQGGRLSFVQEPDVVVAPHPAIEGPGVSGRLLDMIGVEPRFRAVAEALLGHVHTVGAILACTFGAGIGIIGGQTGANVVAALVYPTYIRSTGVGWALGIGRIGSIVGPIVGGIMLAEHWPLARIFHVAALPALCGSLAIGLMGRSHERTQATVPSFADVAEDG